MPYRQCQVWPDNRAPQTPRRLQGLQLHQLLRRLQKQIDRPKLTSILPQNNFGNATRASLLWAPSSHVVLTLCEPIESMPIRNKILRPHSHSLFHNRICYMLQMLRILKAPEEMSTNPNSAIWTFRAPIAMRGCRFQSEYHKIVRFFFHTHQKKKGAKRAICALL